LSITFVSQTSKITTTKSIEEAILKTLAYSDIFDYPLTLDELHKYLPTSATKEEIKNCIENINQVSLDEGYYFLSGRDEIVKIRQAREKKSQPVFKRALFYGKIISRFPFVNMVALTGSLAMLNLSNEIDMDFMLITKPNRLWFARAFAVTFGRLVRLLGDRICINLLVSENNLHWNQHDLYSAREICQMFPVSGFETYNNFRIANLWTQEILPNNSFSKINSNQVSWLQKIIELPFFGKLGDKLEKWSMNFQMKIISRQEHAGDETNFSADICQGNFHQHKKWTQVEYEKRINNVVASRWSSSEAYRDHSEATSLINEGIASSFHSSQ
jgi:hypothetical protein